MYCVVRMYLLKRISVLLYSLPVFFMVGIFCLRNVYSKIMIMKNCQIHTNLRLPFLVVRFRKIKLHLRTLTMIFLQKFLLYL